MHLRPLFLPLLAMAWLLPAVAWSGPLSRHWQVTELRPNKPVVGGVWYRTGSPLDRGLNDGSGYVALYAVEVVPGAQYTLQLKAPHSLSHIRAYVVDRWPGDAGARRNPLPTGPVVIAPHARRVTYRWRIGVSARSRGDVLYLLVRYPQDPGRRSSLAPRIVVFSPPISPMHAAGHGVTYLQGPSGLMLMDDATMTPSMGLAAMPDRFGADRRGRESSGDLVSNGLFTAGLKNWNPIHADRQGDVGPRVGADGLGLLPGTGVRQQLDADVGRDDALVLSADVRVDREPHAAAGPAMTIAVCYRDELGHRHCGDQAYRSVFYAGRTPAGRDAHRETVPNGRWHRFRVDLMQVQPRPEHIESISLIGPARAGSARVREVHLLPEERDETH